MSSDKQSIAPLVRSAGLPYWDDTCVEEVGVGRLQNDYLKRQTDLQHAIHCFNSLGYSVAIVIFSSLILVSPQVGEVDNPSVMITGQSTDALKAQGIKNPMVAPMLNTTNLSVSGASIMSTVNNLHHSPSVTSVTVNGQHVQMDSNSNYMSSMSNATDTTTVNISTSNSSSSIVDDSSSTTQEVSAQ